MKKYIRPLTLKNLQLPNNIFYAPLAGCSDYPFREISKSYHPGIVFCEMVKAEALIRHDPNTYKFLDYSAEMHPIGAQICTSNPKNAKIAAKYIEKLGFDLLDLNCGCPVDKVTKDGSGSGMLKNPQLIGEVLHQMVSEVQIPVTLKIRSGWDDESINVEEIVKIAILAGAQVITVHGRTREQGYRGPANWDYIKRAVQAAGEQILVFGNGDVFSAEASLNMFEITGCHGITVSRGTMGMPWIYREIEQLIVNDSRQNMDELEILKVLKRHFSMILNYQSGKRALLDMRRVGSWYMKLASFNPELKKAMITLKEPDEIMEVLNRY